MLPYLSSVVYKFPKLYLYQSQSQVKSIRKYSLVAVAMLLCGGSALAQLEKPVSVSGFGCGFVLRSNGVGITAQRLVNTGRDGWKHQFYADFVTHKHVRESKVVNHKVENKMPFVFGKLNHTALTRLGYGFSKTLVPMGRFNRVGIDFQSAIGLSLGIQRPVYVRIEEFEGDVQLIKSVRYTPENVPDADKIIGYARNGEGWNELSYRPGVLARMNFAIHWQEYSQVAKQVNLGCALDYFPGGLPIMAFDPNPKLYPTFFVGFMWLFGNH